MYLLWRQNAQNVTVNKAKGVRKILLSQALNPPYLLSV